MNDDSFTDNGFRNPTDGDGYWDPEPRNRGSLRRQLGFPMAALAFIFAGSFLAQRILAAVLSTAAPSLLDSELFLFVLSTGSMYFFSMPLSLLLFRGAKAASPEKHPLSLPEWLGLFAVCFAVSLAGSWIGQLLNGMIAALRGEPVVNDLEETLDQIPLWATFLFVGVLAPIMEELFCRKLVIDRLLCFGELPAVLISGIAFGLIHGNFYQFFYAAMIGIVFGFIYVRTGNILYTISLHVAFNLVGGVYTSEMSRLLLPMTEGEETGEIAVSLPGVLMEFAYLGLLAVCIGGAIAALICFRKKIRLRKSEPLPAGEWLRVSAINPGVWAFLATVVGLFALSLIP